MINEIFRVNPSAAFFLIQKNPQEFYYLEVVHNLK